MSSLEGPADPFFTALDVPSAHEDLDMAPPVEPAGVAPTDDAHDTPPKAHQASASDERITGMLRSHAVDLSPGLEWTDTGASSLEGSPTVLQQKYLASPGFHRYQGDPVHQGTMETEASLYSANSTLPSPLSSPGGPVLQSATNALLSPMAASALESAKLPQPGSEVPDVRKAPSLTAYALCFMHCYGLAISRAKHWRFFDPTRDNDLQPNVLFLRDGRSEDSSLMSVVV